MRLDTTIVTATMAKQCEETGVHFAREEFDNFQDAGRSRCDWTRGTFEGDSLPVKWLRVDHTAHDFRVALGELLSHGRSLTLYNSNDRWLASCENTHDGPLRPSYCGCDATEALYQCVAEEILALYDACEQIMDDAAADEWERLWNEARAYREEDMNTQTVDRIEFQTAAQLIAAIEKLAGGLVQLDEMYLKGVDGEELTEVMMEQETLSDGSVVFNVIVSSGGDPNS